MEIYQFCGIRTVLLKLTVDGKDIYQAFGYISGDAVAWQGTLKNIGFKAERATMDGLPKRLSEAESLLNKYAEAQYHGKNFQVTKSIKEAA